MLHQYAFDFMADNEWNPVFLFPVVLNNIFILNGCGSTAVKLSEVVVEEILPYFVISFWS